MSHREPVSVLYMLPEFGQAKRIIMRELNDKGQTYIDQAFPEILRAGPPNTQEGFLRLVNGSVLQLGGFDTIDRYIGAGPRLVVMSEYALSPHAPRAWQLLQPILLRNGGTAIFPYTPRGPNHGLELYETGLRNPSEWFVSKLACDQTGIDVTTAKGDVITLAQAVKRQVESGDIDEEFARQEFYCDFTSPNSGSYYGRMLDMAESQGRITSVQWDPALPVYTWWDIGWSDLNAIWFVQHHRGGELRCIDYLEDEGKPLSYYLGQLNDRKALGWMFEPRGQLVPHDFGSHEYTLGTTPEQAARELGWRMTVVPASDVMHGIDAVRRILPRCWFDATKCAVGLKRLRMYTKKWSQQLLRFTDPLHDSNSHGADAFRCGVMGMRLAGMHLAPNITQAMRDGERRHLRGTMPVVAPADFSVWSS
jgi:hypothetical protein